MGMTLVLPATAGQRIWVALAEDGEPYAEVAKALQSELGGGNEITVAKWQVMQEKGGDPPDVLVTVGVAALDGLLGEFSRNKQEWQRVPVLGLLVPQSIYEARRALSAVRLTAFSAVLIDQPAERKVALIKRALPDSTRVGLLLGQQTMAQLGELKRAAAAQKLTLTVSQEIDEAKDMSSALRGVLESSDVILAVPDAAVYYKLSIPYILLTSYRARVPLVAYSPALVRSGALLGLYSTPAQMASQAAVMIRSWQGSRRLPPAQAAQEFTVEINAKVARSLGIQIDDAADITRDLMRLAPESGR